MNRRSLLRVILAAGIAPAIVRTGSLMHVRPLQPLTLVLDCGFLPYNVEPSGVPSPQWTVDELACSIGSEAHLIQTWESPGSPFRWIERRVALDPTVDVDVSVKLAHAELRAVAPAIFAAFPDWHTIAAHQFDGFNEQLVDQRHA